MPYKLRHSKGGGYDIVKIATGEVVAHSSDKKKAIGYIWHAKQGEPKTTPRRKTK